MFGSGVVEIDSGKIKGRLQDGVWEFLGIPYAAPPLGNLRFKPPQPVKPWKGIRPCESYGLACAQPESRIYEVGRLGEDCLYLNLWVPEESPEKKMPVMVWIHGGAFLAGSASLQLHRGWTLFKGKKLASLGVIVVTLNYRLGPLGFLAHPLLSKESPSGVSGNYGLMDQIAALRWVQRNIGEFHGDNGRVTLFGESAGATSTAYLMTSPSAKGLFHRAIVQSSPFWARCFLPPSYQFLHQAEEIGQELVRTLGYELKRDPLGALRATDEKKIIAAANLEVSLLPQGLRFGPVVDGHLLPQRPEEVFSRGEQEAMPLVVGSNKDETNYFTAGLKFSLEDYRLLVKELAGEYAEEAMRLFPAKNDREAAHSWSELYTALEFTAPARFLARCMEKKGSRAYLYQFSRVPPTEEGKELCACHGAEIPYVFGELPEGEGFDSTDQRLSLTIMGYWTNLARSGDPRGKDLPRWPPYQWATDLRLELGEMVNVGENIHREACDLAERIHLP